MALLASRDEWSGNLKALESDSKIGRGTGIAQMLEMFDGGATDDKAPSYKAERMMP